MVRFLEPKYEDLYPRKLKTKVDQLGIYSISQGLSEAEFDFNHLIQEDNKTLWRNPTKIKFLAANINKCDHEQRTRLFALLKLFVLKKQRFFRSVYQILFYQLYEIDEMTEYKNQLRDILLELTPNVSSKFVREFVNGNGRVFLKENGYKKIAEDLAGRLMQIVESPEKLNAESYLFNKYRLHMTHRFYQRVIFHFLTQAIKLKVFFNRSNEFSRVFGTVTIEKNRKLFIEKVIQKIPPDKNNSDRFDAWIDIIKSTMGAPYSPFTKDNWLGISDTAKKKFNKWIMLDKIHDFYLQAAKTDPTGRAAFWSEYAEHFLEIQTAKDVNQAVLKLTDKFQLIVEFLEVGNACYLYQLKNEDEYAKVINYLEKSTKASSTKVRFLKNREEGLDFIDNWPHQPSDRWEFKFHNKLRKLGYRRGKI